ncbi:4-hydroxybutyrate coenzyme A transferase [Aduncisulcus paluster]|uniref:4-hydroxybutyrate coenzyme A transferase n=1 Tax=Aduncisulcus paluster TaxID=2918883 RepID=A0ABQ5K1T8_9EUKA|nr:4-hydroxybutyrate coenzyme A transferase [Aduncisulcus paluster]
MSARSVLQWGKLPKIHPTLDDAAKAIESGMRVWIHGTTATPAPLLDAIARRSGELKDVEFAAIHTEGKCSYIEPGMQDSFRHNALFIAHNVRKACNDGRAFFTPIMLHQIPHLMRSGSFPVDATVLCVSPPDEHGFVSLGTNVVTTRQAIMSSKVVIAMVSEEMPRTFGDSQIHLSQIDHLVYHDMPNHEHFPKSSSDVQKKIGDHVASLIEDGACLQTGFGGIADGVLKNLHNHQHLGVHTEMVSEGAVDLTKKGIVTNTKKAILPGKMVASFGLGSNKLYKFMDNNPLIDMRVVDYTNDPRNIAMNDKVVAINGAIEVDMLGQVVASQIGSYIWSGIGGQLDFMTGAAMSKGGKPITALPSTTSKGLPRIVPFINKGAAVDTGRYNARYVVTEYGIADLWGKTGRQRAESLIKVCHPDHRDKLSSIQKFQILCVVFYILF